MKFLIIFLFSTTFIYAKENVIYIQTGWEHSWVENNTITQKEISIWFPISKRNQSFKNPKTKVLWLKTKIPDHSYTDPVLYIRVILQNFETYLDDTLIYHFGDVAGNYNGTPIHFIPIPKDAQGKNLYFKISSTEGEIGIREEIVLGNEKDIYLWIIKKDLERFVFGILYMVIGVFSSILYIRKKLEIYLSFGLFSIITGIFFISSRATGIQYLLYYSDSFWLNITLFTMYLLPVFFCKFTSNITKTTKKFILFLASLHLVVFLIMTFVFFTYQIFNQTYLLYLLSVTISIIVIALVYESIKGNIEARIFILGLLIYLSTILHDVLRLFGILPYSIVLGPKGFFALILCIIYILEKRFSNVHLQLEIYSQELELAKENLEIKVIERTQKLSQTLEEVKKLKYAQDGDYFLTSLLVGPLATNKVNSSNIKIEFYIKQKKEFEFNGNKHQIGGDICIADNIKLGNRNFVIFANGDAMGKSLQGAGGTLVFGSVFQSILSRNKLDQYTVIHSPEEWLKNVLYELQIIFESFDCLMLVSCAIGLIEENTGELFYVNAEHPWTVLYRDKKASFIENESTICQKIGLPKCLMPEEDYTIQKFLLKSNDILFIGSDGRDDIEIGAENNKKMNMDPYLFLKSVEEGEGELKIIPKLIQKKGILIDDLSIIRVEYLGNILIDSLLS